MSKIGIESNESGFPTHWYNILGDLPDMPPPQASQKEIQLLQKITAPECLNQEFSKEPWILIPPELKKYFFQISRPRSLFRATRLEKYLDLPMNIRLYYKAEYESPTGSHKLNTAITQLFFIKKHLEENGADITKARIVTETGAGQWGSAVAYAAKLLGFKDVTIYWVKNIYSQKANRINFMETCGAKVIASPSNQTSAGRIALQEDQNHQGDLGIAISEGLEDASREENSFYVIGSVLNHVLLHQTIIGLETVKQFKRLGVFPDVLISCVGGGSNFGGFILPFAPFVLKREKEIKFLAVQSRKSASLVNGDYRYDRADHAGLTPNLMMYTLGHETKLDPIKAGGLMYHAAAPIISFLRHKGFIDACAPETDLEEKYVYEAGKLFSILEEKPMPAPESCFSIWGAIKEAQKEKSKGQSKTIAFNVSGNELIDQGIYPF